MFLSHHFLNDYVNTVVYSTSGISEVIMGTFTEVIVFGPDIVKACPDLIDPFVTRKVMLISRLLGNEKGNQKMDKPKVKPITLR